MKPFNLEEYLKNPSRKVVTRDGKSVIIHCINFSTVQPIVTQIEGTGYSLSYTKDGKCSICQNSIDDLFFAPEKHERWINLYKIGSEGYFLGANIYIDKEHAETVAGRNCVATIKIEWEE